MKLNLVVSSKGQITLPAPMRRALGLGQNSIVTAETQDGRIVLSPAMVVETETYSADDIAAWQAADRFALGERQAIEQRLQRPAAPTPRPRKGARGA